MNRTLNKVWDTPLELLRDVDRALGSRFNFDTGDLTAQYPVDIHEDDQGLSVEAELPGFTKDQVEVSIDQGVLTINAQRTAQEKTGGKMHLNERQYTTVTRKFTLPSTIDATQVEAALADGVLTLRLLKRDDVKPHKITVK